MEKPSQLITAKAKESLALLEKELPIHMVEGNRANLFVGMTVNAILDYLDELALKTKV